MRVINTNTDVKKKSLTIKKDQIVKSKVQFDEGKKEDEGED